MINGPVHTNDAMQIGGSILFTDPKTETSWQTTQTNKWWGSGTPSASGYQPHYAPLVTIPPSNASLLANATSYGCVSRRHQDHLHQRRQDDGAEPQHGDLDGLLPLGQPTSRSPPPGSPFRRSSTSRTPPAPAPRRAASTIGLGYPLSGELPTTDSSYTGPDYACNKGTAYVSGVLNGTTTIGSSQDIVAVGNITYADQTATSNDILGLIPTHFMWVYHPVKASDQSTC